MLLVLLPIRHVGSQLPNQGSNPQPLHWKVESSPLNHQESPKFNIFRLRNSRKFINKPRHFAVQATCGDWLHSTLVHHYYFFSSTSVHFFPPNTAGLLSRQVQHLRNHWLRIHPAGHRAVLLPGWPASPAHRVVQGFQKAESVGHSVMSDSLQPHGLEPTRFFCPWNSPGKNSGAGCHSFLQGSRDWNWISLITGRFSAICATREPSGKRNGSESSVQA